MKQKVNLFWFRRDLRLEDNAALYHALKAGLPVVPMFIFDRVILDKLEEKADRRVAFIHLALTHLQKQLLQLGSTIKVLYDFPLEVFSSLLNEFDIQTVFANRDYEPYARERDASIYKLLSESETGFTTYKDQVIFEKSEVVKDDQKPYTVFTPYSRKWKAALNDFYFKSYPTEKFFSNFLKQPPSSIPSLESMGFKKVEEPFPSQETPESIIDKYTQTRNFPGNPNATSRLGVHLRFGTISIRTLARNAQDLNQTFLNELIWRDFYQMILWHFPRVGLGKAFKPEYEHIEWRNNEAEFKLWCEGKTGYPIVDAGMRELNETGFMHNRVRMIVASFLTKHLLIDWRWGEAYFAEKLLDFDLASNNGGWQWAAGSGVDAAPYFRIFNPHLQTEKFDKQYTYIKQWVPEMDTPGYPKPIVEHAFARKRALEVYANTLKKT